MKPKLTNEDKTRKLQTKARTALLVSAGRDWTSAKNAVDEAAKLELKAINGLRTCGIKLQQAAGHEQVSFEFFHNANGTLPKNMGFKAVKFCVHLARNFDKPIETLDDARSDRQMMFEVFGQAAEAKRLEMQTAHDKNPWDDFVNIGSSLTTLFKSLETDAMEDWGRDKLGTFIRTTKPIADACRQAQILFEEK